MMRNTEFRCQIEFAVPSCSFKTIPNGLRQHPNSVTIIHTALIEGSP